MNAKEMFDLLLEYNKSFEESEIYKKINASIEKEARKGEFYYIMNVDDLDFSEIHSIVQCYKAKGFKVDYVTVPFDDTILQRLNFYWEM